MTGQAENLDHSVSADDETRELDQLGDEPSFDGLLGQLSDMMREAEGWNGLNATGGALQKQRDMQRAAFKREANLFRDTFMTPDGRKLLELFLDRTVRRPHLPESIVGMTMDQITPVMLAREAENNFVRAILEAIAQAENKPTPTRAFS